MKLKLTLFGITKEIIGDRELEYDMPAPVDVSRLKHSLKTNYPELARIASLAIAVNGTYASEHELLKEHDEIVLIPPVSGG